MPGLTLTPTPTPEVHDCELCRALLAVGASIVVAEARERAARRASMRVVTRAQEKRP